MWRELREELERERKAVKPSNQLEQENAEEEAMRRLGHRKNQSSLQKVQQWLFKKQCGYHLLHPSISPWVWSFTIFETDATHFLNILCPSSFSKSATGYDSLNGHSFFLLAVLDFGTRDHGCTHLKACWCSTNYAAPSLTSIPCFLFFCLFTFAIHCPFTYICGTLLEFCLFVTAFAVYQHIHFVLVAMVDVLSLFGLCHGTCLSFSQYPSQTLFTPCYVLCLYLLFTFFKLSYSLRHIIEYRIQITEYTHGL